MSITFIFFSHNDLWAQNHKNQIFCDVINTVPVYVWICVLKVLTSINVAENIIFASKIWAKWKEHYYYYCCCCKHTHTHIIQYFPHYTEYLLSTTNIPFIYSVVHRILFEYEFQSNVRSIYIHTIVGEKLRNV